MIIEEITREKVLQEKLLEYGKSPCKGLEQGNLPSAPMADESHVLDWKEYLDREGENDWQKLQAAIPQLNIPIAKDISKSEAYADVARKGKPFEEEQFGKKFILSRPDLFRCTIYSHPVGSLPVLSSADRGDFENLYRLLGCRCEPVEINPSVNALMVAGFNNWDRVNKYKEKWLERNDEGIFGEKWLEEMKRVIKEDPGQFRDRFILVMGAPYSGVSALELGLDYSEESWLEKSLSLRIEHEFTHYAVKRIYDVMRIHLWDEVLADFMGISLALRDFEAHWFLRFLGLDEQGNVLPNARITHYTGDIPGELFAPLCRLLVKVGYGLESFHYNRFRNIERRQGLRELAGLSLLEMAGQ